jgi:hypothetical protein
MHNQLRQDVVVDLRDLTSDERKRFIDVQLAILDTRRAEALADLGSARHRAETSKEWAKREAVAREAEQFRLQTDKEKYARDLKARDLSDIQQQEYLRPSRLHFAEVTYDEERKQFAAICGGVTAYGDSPEMACDNFDHLWLYGETP